MCGTSMSAIYAMQKTMFTNTRVGRCADRSEKEGVCNGGTAPSLSHIRGQGHDGLVNCVRTGMSKSVSISKTFAAANAIHSHKFAGHDVLVSAFVAMYECPPVIFSVVGISRNR